MSKNTQSQRVANIIAADRKKGPSGTSRKQKCEKGLHVYREHTGFSTGTKILKCIYCKKRAKLN